MFASSSLRMETCLCILTLNLGGGEVNGGITTLVNSIIDEKTKTQIRLNKLPSFRQPVACRTMV